MLKTKLKLDEDHVQNRIQDLFGDQVKILFNDQV